MLPLLMGPIRLCANLGCGRNVLFLPPASTRLLGMVCRVLSVFFVCFGCVASTDAQLQPFRMPWDDASPGITNLHGWQVPIATTSEWVRTTPAGHYEVNGGQVRFLGVNIGAASAMPTHALASAHAARLARFGFNTVRLHHLEAPWDKANVLIDYASGSSRNLSADRLDRLQYLVAQLADQGIRTNLNLLVSREFQAADGLGPEITQMGWKDQHVLGFFNADALALHKEHATKLLTAPNPYRGGVPLGLDPAVAFVEIMNENGLLQNWFGGLLDTMPNVYRGQLQTRWNSWLAGRYATTAELLAGWGAVDEPLGANMLANGDFAAGVTSWNREQHSGAVASFTGTADFNGQPAIKITETTAGLANWHVQLNQSSLALVANGYYTISFWAKADRAIPLHASLSRAYGDYGGIGSDLSTTLGTDWQHYTVALQNGAAETNARVNFNGFGDRICTVWLADVRVQPGGVIGGLPAGVSLEARNVPNLLRNSSGAGQTLKQRLDWARCLLALEADYWSAMLAHIKTTLGYPGIVWGTIIANSPPNVQGVFDAIDSHAYWQHPTWPAGQDWNPETWTMPNTSMVNSASAGTLAGIARQRVKGMPHNVTEYQHPSPSSYTAEGPLLAAAYAGLQDWDGLWMFAYETTQDEAVTGFFDHGTHPGRMANNLLAAALFRRGDVKAAVNEYTMAFTPTLEVETATTAGGAWSIADGSHLGVPATLALASRVSLSIGAGATGLSTPPAPPAGLAIASDTGELLWDNSQATKGVVTINTARTKAVVGFTSARSWDLGGVQIAPGTTSLDWTTIGITLLEGDSFAGGGRGVIVATGNIENTGQIWKDATHTSLGSNWGRAPTLIEVVPASVTLPVATGRVSAWALNAQGQRMDALPVVDAGGNARLVLGGSGPTIWYEFAISALGPPVLTAQPTSVSAGSGGNVTFSVSAIGNPTPVFQWQISTDGGGTWSNLADGGAYGGVTTPALSVQSATSSMNGHQFRCVVSNNEGAVISSPGILAVSATAGPRLINVSTRAFAGSGESTLIVGFYIAGTGSKTLLIRGVGPKLLDFQVPVVVADPSLVVYSGNTPIDSNDNWDAALAPDFATVGAFGLDLGSKDAALKVTLPPGAYTIHLVNPGQMAEALVEVYDLSRDAGTRLINLSCRLHLSVGQTIIVGTYLQNAPVPLVIRNGGPALGPLGVSGFAPDTHLRVYSGQTEIGANNDWDIALEPFFAAVGAFGFPPGSKDAALRVAVQPGSYTVHATAIGSGGIALVELYESS